MQSLYPGEGCLRFNCIFLSLEYVKSTISRGGGLDLTDTPPHTLQNAIQI